MTAGSGPDAGLPIGSMDGDEWLAQVAESAAEATGTPVELLGGFLPMLAEAAVHGRSPQPTMGDSVTQDTSDGDGSRVATVPAGSSDQASWTRSR